MSKFPNRSTKRDSSVSASSLSFSILTNNGNGRGARQYGATKHQLAQKLSCR